jgi:hypothetical protein
MAPICFAGAPRKPVRIVTYGFDNGDGTLSLLNSSGKTIGVIAASDASDPVEIPLTRPEWELSIARFVGEIRRQNRRDYYGALGAWDRKAVVWVKTQNQHFRIRCYKRFFSPTKRRTWDDSVRCMIHQYKNAHHKAMYSSDVWNQWSETVSRNHRRKDAERGNKKRIAEADRGAGLQMRWHWD